MRAGTRRGFWRRVVVWWVVVSFALSALIVGGLASASLWLPRSQPISRSNSLRLEDSFAKCVPLFNYRMTIEAHGPFWDRVEGSDVHYIGTRSGHRRAVWDEPEDLMGETYVRSNAPMSLAGAALRLRDCLGWILLQERRWYQSTRRAMEIRIIVPMGVIVSSPQVIAVPLELNTAYPVSFTLDAGRSVVLVRVWNVLAVAASLGGLLVGIGVGSVAMRRRQRLRADRCAACGYSLVGIADDAPCPECGEKR